MSRQDSTQREDEINHQSPEPEQKFRGTRTPPEVWDLLFDGRINCTEFVLLSLIDSLVDSRGEGCWASNEYLASRLNLKKRQVQILLAHLSGKDTVKDGIIIRKGVELLRWVGWKHIGTERRRVLETKWSRIEVEGAQLNAGGAKKCARPHAKKCALSIKEEGEREAKSARDARSPPKQAQNGRRDLDQNQAKTPDSDHLEGAVLLRDSLREYRRVVKSYNREKWARELKLLETQDKQSYMPTLQWFCAHCSKEDKTKYGLPSIDGARQFRLRYGWIEDCMEKALSSGAEVPARGSVVKVLHNPDGTRTKIFDCDDASE